MGNIFTKASSDERICPRGTYFQNIGIIYELINCTFDPEHYSKLNSSGQDLIRTSKH